MLTVPRRLSFTPVQFAQVCAANPEEVVDLDADGTLMEELPARCIPSVLEPRH
jgi:hypothetical protein